MAACVIAMLLGSPAAAMEPIPGDFTGDGRVNNHDLNLMLRSWTADPPDACFGTCEFFDNDELNALLNNWGAGVPTATPAPEPSTLVLAGLACSVGGRRRR